MITERLTKKGSYAAISTTLCVRGFSLKGSSKCLRGEGKMVKENGNNLNSQSNMENCWNCKYQDITRQDTFLGICTWFSKHGRKDKQIPPHKVDVGCNHFELKQKDACQ